MTQYNNKIHNLTFDNFKTFFSDLSRSVTGEETNEFVDVLNESAYESYIILGTPFNLPNTSDNVFSQKTFYRDGGLINYISPYLDDIRSGKTCLLFMFNDWWGTCNDNEKCGQLSGGLVSYDIYNWTYQSIKDLDICKHTRFNVCTDIKYIKQHTDLPLYTFNESFNRYLTFKNHFNPDSTMNKRFLFTLNRRPRPHRIYNFYKLFQNNLLNDSKYTFHFFVESVNQNYTHIDITRDYLNGWIEKEIDNDFFKYYGANIKTNYDVVNDYQYYNELLDIYNNINDCFIEVVCEYNYSDYKVLLSEKISRSIVMKKPFVAIGDRYLLQNLRDLGFKTFDGFWNEDYDVKLSAKQRIDCAVETLVNIKNNYNWKGKYSSDMQEILDYNYNHYYNEYFQSQKDILRTLVS